MRRRFSWRICRKEGCPDRVVGASAFCAIHYLEWRNTAPNWERLRRIKW